MKNVKKSVDAIEKPSSKSKRMKVIALISAAVILTILVMMFVFRGWLRVTVMPKTADMLHAGKLDKVANDEFAKLQSPLEALGYKNIEKKPATCKLDAAKRFATGFYCLAQSSAYQEINQNASTKETMSANAAKLQKLLEDNGWEGTYTNDTELTSLETLVSNINKGIDYTPDAAYSKTMGNITCIFDSNTSFSSPGAPAIATHYGCGQSLKFLGDPTASTEPVVVP